MSNGSARHRVVLVVLDGWGYRPEREGNAIELATTPVWHRLWDALPRTLLDASGLAVGLPEGQMGNSEVGPPQPRRRPGGAPGPGADLPEHPERRVLPAPAAGRAVHLAAPDRRHPAPRRPARPRRRARARPPPARLRRAGRSGTGCRPSPSTASSTAATPRRPSAPRSCARCCSTCGGSPGSAGGHRLADRPLLRHGPRPALGPDPAGLRRHGARRRHAGGASGARGPGGLPAGRDGRVHPAAGASSGTACRSPRCATATASCSSTIAATACARSWARSRCDGFDGVRPRRPAGALLRHDDAVRSDLPAAAGVSAVQPGADPGRGAGRPRADPVPDRGDREVPARHVLLQRRLRAAVPGRGALPHPVAARWRRTTWRRR